MRHSRTRALALTVIAALALSACQAPLKPKSQQGDPSPSPGVADRGKGMGETTPSPKATATPKPPRIKVPSPAPTTRTLGPLLGGDISWPQCPTGLGIPEKRSEGKPLPDASAEFVVIGLTNGPGFVANPCLQSQVDWAKQRHLRVAAYSVISGPTRFSPAGVTGEELGARQARFNIASMRRAGLQTPIVWLDVETVPHFDWGPDTDANAAVIRGAADAYGAAGYDVGVYSTPYLYKGVAGSLRLNVPEWRAAGQTSRQEAVSRCGGDWVIQGGHGVLGQWVEGDRDKNVTCPGVPNVEQYFHRY